MTQKTPDQNPDDARAKQLVEDVLGHSENTVEAAIARLRAQPDHILRAAVATILFLEPSSLQDRIAALIRGRSETVLPDLKAALSGTDRRAVLNSLRMIAWLESDAHPTLPLLKELLVKDDPAVQVLSLRALQSMGLHEGDASIRIIVDCTQSSSPEVRIAALTALQRILFDGELALSVYDKALDDEHEGVRLAAIRIVRSLGQGARSLVPRILGRAKDHNPEIQREVVDALKEIDPDPRRLPVVLLSLLDSELTEGVRARIIQVLWDVTKDPDLVIGPLQDLIRTAAEVWVVVGCDVIAGMGPAAARLVNSLIARIDVHSRNWDFLWAAVGALGQIGPAAVPALPKLAELLGHPSGLVAGNAAESIANIGLPALPYLIQALDSGNSQAKEHAADALGRLGIHAKSGGKKLLGMLLSGEQEEVKHWAAIAAGDIYGMPEAVPWLVRCLEKSSNNVALVRAAAALEKIGPRAASALPALRAKINDRRESVAAAARSAMEAISSGG